MLLDFKGFWLCLLCWCTNSNHLIDESLHGFQIKREKKTRAQHLQHVVAAAVFFFNFAWEERDIIMSNTIYFTGENVSISEKTHQNESICVFFASFCTCLNKCFHCWHTNSWSPSTSFATGFQEWARKNAPKWTISNEINNLTMWFNGVWMKETKKQNNAADKYN